MHQRLCIRFEVGSLPADQTDTIRLSELVTALTAQTQRTIMNPMRDHAAASYVSICPGTVPPDPQALVRGRARVRSTLGPG